MIDRIFSAVLAFMVLGGGTLAIGSALFGFDRPAASMQLQSAVVELPRVEITARRANVVMAARNDLNPGLKTRVDCDVAPQQPRHI
ncbi:MAG TPA: hypothetical protein VF319_07905 [Caldimonas sp.]